jgi:hypothetical protein
MQPGRRKRLQAFGESDVDIGPTPGQLCSGKRFLQRLQVTDTGRHLDLRNGGRRIAGAQQCHHFVGPGGWVCQVGAFNDVAKQALSTSRALPWP